MWRTRLYCLKKMLNEWGEKGGKWDERLSVGTLKALGCRAIGISRRCCASNQIQSTDGCKIAVYVSFMSNCSLSDVPSCKRKQRRATPPPPPPLRGDAGVADGERLALAAAEAACDGNLPARAARSSLSFSIC